MKTPPPIIVVDLFPEVLNSLLDLLHSLSPDEWNRPTVAAAWNVHDIALHLLGVETGILSRKRDGYIEAHVSLAGWEELVAWLNQRNETWVQTNRRLSPQVVCALLHLAGEQTNAYFRTLDPYALGGPVSWAGPELAPVWLDLAREFTERWHHQQHIRDAVGKPGLTEPRYLAPVLAAFVRSLPHAFRSIDAEEGSAVTLTIIGDAGCSWSIIREAKHWQLYMDKPPRPKAEVVLPEDVAWRLFTKGITKEAVRTQMILHGDRVLGEQILEAVSIIA
jgi:uncharacterized protein (TIGR03083 family)